MNKKRISVVMATAMAASMAAVPMTASADDTVELTFMGWEASPLETQAVQDGIAKFEEQYPNIKVNYTPGLAGSEYNAKLLSSAAAGSLPDVMFVASESYRNMVAKGALLDITDTAFLPVPYLRLFTTIRTCSMQPVLNIRMPIRRTAGRSTSSVKWQSS